VPRDGFKDDGRINILERLEAAIAGVRLYRGKAIEGGAQFDSGPIDDEPLIGSDGSIELGYLQRRVGMQRYPWSDAGSRSSPRLLLPGHAGGKAEDGGPKDIFYNPDPTDDVEFTGVKHDASSLPSAFSMPSTKQAVNAPAEVCYLDRRAGRFDSGETFDYIRRRHGRKPWSKPTCPIWKDHAHAETEVYALL
jgi:hypothetical protein